MTIAGAVAHFYYARGNRDKLPRSPLWSSFNITLWYHFGTVAIGSFILALLIFVRMFLTFIERRSRWLTRSKVGNTWLKYIFSCLTLILWVIENIVKFINRCNPHVIPCCGTSKTSGSTHTGLVQRAEHVHCLHCMSLCQWLYCCVLTTTC